MTRSTLPLALRVVAAAALAAACGAAPAVAAPVVVHAGEATTESSLLLVLGVEPGQTALLDARTAPVAPKAVRAAAAADGLLLSLESSGGTVLVLGEVRVPESLHGPILTDDGVVRCVAFEQPSVVVAARLPWPASEDEVPVRLRAWRRAASYAPTTGAALRDAIEADPRTAGLRAVGSFDLRRALEPR